MKMSDLHCCGNCLFRISIEKGSTHVESCSKTDSNKASYEICEHWEYDSLPQEKRKSLEPVKVNQICQNCMHWTSYSSRYEDDLEPSDCGICKLTTPEKYGVSYDATCSSYKGYES